MCFTLADVKGKGRLTTVDLLFFVEQLHGGTVSDATLQKKIASACDNTEDGMLGLQDFLNLGQRYPTMLFPMFKLQTEMKNAWGRCKPLR
jgi:hypothetical protein